MTTLPPLLVCNDGVQVTTPQQWAARRVEVYDAIVPLEYGGLPPRPAQTTGEVLHRATVRAMPGAGHWSIRVTAEMAEGPVSFMLDVVAPPGDGPWPVALTGDRCWRYATDAVVAEAIGRGYAIAQFNRVELAADLPQARDLGGLYDLYPGAAFGCLAAWAWGYHRCVDVLSDLPGIDAKRIAITGHSRGGKTVLLAGATDQRVALVGANNSGCGGAGCFRVQGPDCETLAAITKTFPYWFGPRFGDYAGREKELPFDQHFLKALIAPRGLITMEARGDLWANPTGTRVTHDAARDVWRLFGAKDTQGIVYREGGHDHGLADWQAFLDFADRSLLGKPVRRTFDDQP